MIIEFPHNMKEASKHDCVQKMAILVKTVHRGQSRIWERMHTIARRACFRLTHADCGAQKSKGKGTQVPKDKEDK